MIRQRFRDIKPYLYVCDNMQLGNHKMAKFIPMYNVLNNKMQLFGELHRQLNIDKAMVSCFDRHNFKKFIRGKLIRSGYKCWMLACASERRIILQFIPKKVVKTMMINLAPECVKDTLPVCQEPMKY